jgi:hypothetical protein
MIENGKITMDDEPMAVTTKLIEVGHATYMKHALKDYSIVTA